MKKRNGGEGQPEYRVSVVFLLPTFSDSRYCSLACDHRLMEQLVLTQIGMIMMPIGLVIFVSRYYPLQNTRFARVRGRKRHL
jgi:hypothetical protein